MSGSQKFAQKLNVQIIQCYPLQQFPMIAISLAHQSGGNKLIFGSSLEPSTRMFRFYDLDPYVNKTKHFITRNTCQYLCGLLPMMFQSYHRNQYQELMICGPKGTVDFIYKCKYLLGIRFLAFAGLDIIPNNKWNHKLGIGNREAFIKFLRHENSHSYFDKSIEDVNDYIRQNIATSFNPLHHIQNKTIQDSFAQVVPLISKCGNLINYLVLFNPTSKIDYELLAKLDIPVSRVPDIREGYKLKDGRKININDITSLDCQKSAQCILILDLKSVEEVNNFINHEFLTLKEQYTNYKNSLLKLNLSPEQEDIIKQQTLLIIHGGLADTLKSAEYAQLIAKFSTLQANIKHIVTSQDFYQTLDKESEEDLKREQFDYYHLDFLDQMRRLIPNYYKGRTSNKQFYSKTPVTQQMNIEQLWPSENVMLSMRIKTIQLNQGNIFFEQLQLNRTMQYQLKIRIREVLNKLSSMLPLRRQEEFLRLTMLGTASTVETQSRSTSCLFLTFPNDFNMILDCGSGSLYQIYQNAQNEQQFKENLIKLQLIFISHFHSDHHMGLLEILIQRYELTKEPIYVILPYYLYGWCHQQFKKFMLEKEGHENYSKYIRIVLHHEFNQEAAPFLKQEELSWKLKEKDISNMEPENPPMFQEFDHERTNYAQLATLLEKNQVTVKLIKTNHCAGCHGIQITKNNYRMVYSSDREGATDRKAHRFLEAAQDCDLMVHECTFSDDSQDRAHEVMHSTILQALLTAIEVRAKHLVLTHFTRKSIIQLKALMHEDGNLDKVAFEQYYNRHYNWTTKVEFRIVYEYLQNNVILANDFQSFSNKDVKDLPKISRIVFNSQIA